MNSEDLKEHLRIHILWVRGESGGKRADLRGADLSSANLYGANLSSADLSSANLYGANLRGANLYGANLTKTIYEGKAILSFQYKKHIAYFFGMNEITIGCHKHSIKEWLANFQEIGKQNGYTQQEIDKYGKFIKGCAKIQAELDKETK